VPTRRRAKLLKRELRIVHVFSISIQEYIVPVLVPFAIVLWGGVFLLL